MTLTAASKTDDLKQRVVRSGVSKLGGQIANFALRLVSLVVMAHLLSPTDVGLFSMVAVVTGFYGIFTAAGLSSATIQRVSITHGQMSTLFWVNMLVGAVLGALCLATAPVLVAVFHEQRLLAVTAAMAAGFLVNAAGVQHIALLQRDLRFATLSVVEVLSQVGSIATGIALALAGFGYWALVGSTMAAPSLMTVLAWATTRWIPGRPRRDAEIVSMLRFGGVITFQSALNYGTQNIDKVLLGRFRGPGPLGIYGRAYQLVAMPMANLSAAMGWVIFSALSRIQDDSERFRSYFLKGYSVVITVIVPILVFAAAFADDAVKIALGPQWTDVARILRLLTPAGLVVALTEPPIYWVLHALGKVGRSLRITSATGGLILLACLAGVSRGGPGIATAYSAVMVLWLVPCLAWSVHGTPVRLRDLLQASSSRLAASVVAAAIAILAVQEVASSLARLLVGGVLLFCAYFTILCVVFRQWAFYRGLVRDLRLFSSGG